MTKTSYSLNFKWLAASKNNLICIMRPTQNRKTKVTEFKFDKDLFNQIFSIPIPPHGFHIPYLAFGSFF